MFATAFQLNYMSQTQRAGNIVLLPKSGDPLDPNRRPITLLNVDYKILAKALGNRLADVMPDIVGPFQTCAVRGKCIQHNLWLMRDLIEFVKVRDLPCALPLVSLNQEKAFDMVDHDFLFRSLESFGLNSVLFIGSRYYIRTSRAWSLLTDLLLVPSRFEGSPSGLSPLRCCLFSSAKRETLNETGGRLHKTKGLRLGGWRGQSLPFDATWSDVMIRVNGIWPGYGALRPPLGPRRLIRWRQGSTHSVGGGSSSLGRLQLLIVLLFLSFGILVR
ncbi:pol-like protein [Apostichopus japonicus]|uniref:Pol-like protein n=1 Tax=Stichopus japonicus TaxID=307972 RepID=A0A2G8L7X1_STIJA|nr:pol-like protein [Apostichopus japonicus]